MALEDLAASYEMGFSDSFESSSQSIFDSRSATDTSNNMTQSVYAELNQRERNYGSLSVIDKMRGVTGGRLDMSGSIGLTEQYMDSSLDKRTFNGTYNVTLTDIYKDEKLFKSHFGLHTDSFVEEEESNLLEGDMARDHGKKAEHDQGFVGIVNRSNRNNKIGSNTLESTSDLMPSEENEDMSSVFVGSDKTLRNITKETRQERLQREKEKVRKAREQQLKFDDAPIAQDSLDKAKDENVRMLKDIERKYGSEILTKEDKDNILKFGIDTSLASESVEGIQKRIKFIEEEINNCSDDKKKAILNKKLELYKKLLMQKILL